MNKQMEKATEESGFLDGRDYTAAFLYEFFALIVGNGIYANELAPTATNENMTITHGVGHAWINGVCYKNTTPFVLDIATADGILNRYDSLMLRLNLSINEVYAVIVQGDYAANPTPPAVTRNVETFDLKICDIYIPAGCTKITQAQITDTRLDASVCGVPVFPVEHLDTTTFYRQIAADLDDLKQKERAEILALLGQLNDLVESDTAGKLVAEINKKISKDGTTPMTGPLPMGGFKVTGLGEPDEDNDAVSLSYANRHYTPSGFGLGLETNFLPRLSTPEEVDVCTAAGWYEYYGSNLYGAGTSYGGVLVIPSMWSVTQFFFCRVKNGCYMKRIQESGVWSGWEWVNPPMTIGVEYRTTERWMEKPIYIKAVDCGYAPAKSRKSIDHGTANVENVIARGGYMGASSLPFEDSSGNKCFIADANRQSIVVQDTYDWSAIQTITAWIKYTKTTD